MLLRIALAVALLTIVALGTVAYRRRQARVGAASPFVAGNALPRVPDKLLEGAERTWVVFTTPYCATCGPVEAQLRAADPAASIVRVDATQEVGLAEGFGIRAAPTALLADASGTIEVRLAGAAAVDRYLTSLRPGVTGPRLS